MNVNIDKIVKPEFSLAAKVSIVIPSTLNVFFNGQKIKLNAPKEILSVIIKDTEYAFAEMFGGFSAHPQYGGWIDSDNGEIVRENSLVVEAYTDKLTVQKLEQLACIAREISKALNQDCVLFTVNGKALFVRHPQQIAA